MLPYNICSLYTNYNPQQQLRRAPARWLLQDKPQYIEDFCIADIVPGHKNSLLQEQDQDYNERRNVQSQYLFPFPSAKPGYSGSEDRVTDWFLHKDIFFALLYLIVSSSLNGGGSGLIDLNFGE